MLPTTHIFPSWDNTPLTYHAWLPAAAPTSALLLFHRGHEHGNRWQHTIDALALPSTAIFAWDQRNHGLSPGPRGFCPDISTLAKDADFFARHIAQTYRIPLDKTALVASSVGAVIAIAWVHDFAPPLCAMVLAAPALRVKLYVPMAIPSLRLMHKVRPRSAVKSYVKSRMLTHDTAQAAAYDADPLIFPQISVRYLLDLHDTSTRLIKDAPAIHTPTLLLTAGKDWVVKLAPQKKFFNRLASTTKMHHHFPMLHHSLFHELHRDPILNPTRDFLVRAFTQPHDSTSLLTADKSGYTRTEFDQLQKPASLRWPLVRANLKTFGRLSKGIRLGWKSGFDSGIMLDYIYLNKSRGFTPLGKIIDHYFLNAIGWRGIRLRRQNLQRLLQDTIQRLHAGGLPVHILDVASGPGRYVLETMHRLPHIPISAALRDYQQSNLQAARTLAGTLNLQRVTTTQADAFDRDSLSALAPKPTIAIASGIYELFPENAPIQRSLAGIADALHPEGYLIYTCQPWHPQVELIARTLTNREGHRWIMRRRTQAEMDALVRAAGFEKIEQDIDPWGIFTVSLARPVKA